jgi:hypothetical protein
LDSLEADDEAAQIAKMLHARRKDTREPWNSGMFPKQTVYSGMRTDILFGS